MQAVQAAEDRLAELVIKGDDDAAGETSWD
jgi:hypothetical protein